MRSRGYTDCITHVVSKTWNKTPDIPAPTLLDNFTAERVRDWICGSLSLSSCCFEIVRLSVTFRFKPFTVSSVK
jgi:hypothetical protein